MQFIELLGFPSSRNVVPVKADYHINLSPYAAWQGLSPLHLYRIKHLYEIILSSKLSNSCRIFTQKYDVS